MMGKLNFEELEQKVKLWAEVKGIYETSTSAKQLQKTAEEFTETAIAIGARDKDEIKDGIGDILVTLINVAELEGLSLSECLAHSYSVISKRSGKMVNGVFVKD